VGFGVVEGIIYASNYYNGIASFEIYFTRFISCVALHAIWTASAAIMVARHKDGFKADTGTEWLMHLILMISVPAVLHGLYDTLLKREMNAYALLLAVMSFAWLVVMTERARSEDPLPIPAQLRARAAA
jgi:RsiW-degrading membrane proteinase PrsW (M82 family)